MSDVKPNLSEPLFASLKINLTEASQQLQAASAEDRVQWGLQTFGNRILLTSSFGAQAAVLLHMVTKQSPNIPVVMVDTGYLFPETYRFIDELTEKLNLNLKIYRSSYSAGWQEARHGKLWEKGVEGITQYNTLNKVEPMNRALEELGAWAWIAGLRRQQSKSRSDLGVLVLQRDRLKIHPIVDWTDRDVYQYLTKHGLPYHPLWHEGYVSIGDTHTTRKMEAGMTEEETRFFGLKRECGLHEGVQKI